MKNSRRQVIRHLAVAPSVLLPAMPGTRGPSPRRSRFRDGGRAPDALRSRTSSAALANSEAASRAACFRERLDVERSQRSRHEIKNTSDSHISVLIP